MSKVISKTIEIKTPKLPPDLSFIEQEIKTQLQGDIVRWAIVDVNDNILKISASYES